MNVRKITGLVLCGSLTFAWVHVSHAEITKNALQNHQLMFERIIVQTPLNDERQCQAKGNSALNNTIADSLMSYIAIQSFLSDAQKNNSQLSPPLATVFQNTFKVNPAHLDFNLKFPNRSPNCNLYTYLNRLLQGEDVRLLVARFNRNDDIDLELVPIQNMKLLFLEIDGKRETYKDDQNRTIYPFYYGNEIPSRIFSQYVNQQDKIKLHHITLAQFFQELRRANNNYLPQIWISTMSPQENMSFQKPQTVLKDFEVIKELITPNNPQK